MIIKGCNNQACEMPLVLLQQLLVCLLRNRIIENSVASAMGSMQTQVSVLNIFTVPIYSLLEKRAVPLEKRAVSQDWARACSQREGISKHIHQMQQPQHDTSASSLHIPLLVQSWWLDICRLRLDIISIILETKVLLESVCLLGLQLHPFLVALFLM